MAFCTSCGYSVQASDHVCPRCGAVRDITPLKKQTVALLLASTLGLFGAHRFYLGLRFAGLLYLLFCWTGIPTLLALVESIFYACTSPRQWADRYNQGRIGDRVPNLLVVLTVGLPLLLLALLTVSVLFPDLDF